MEVAYPLFTAGAFFLGAFHAMEPGHGKSIVAAYLIGTRGTTMEALLLGLTTAFTHLTSVVIIAALALAASTRYAAEEWEPVLGFFSGVTVLVVGLWMLSKSRHPLPHSHPPAHPSFLFSGESERPGTVGIVTLGVSGGIVPCPAAIAILLMAIATGQLMKGLFVVVSFSIGLTVALIGLGLFACRATSLVVRWMGSESKVTATLPTLSALFVSLVGLGLTVRASFRLFL
jgi:ABC-type nickel/cobalt efflux system permease component RcnA